MTDLRWLDDLDPFGAETADASEELAQDCYHVIEQDLASNLDDPTRGLGVANILSSVLPNDFTDTVDQELMQDDRVAIATSSFVYDTSGGPAGTTATLLVNIQPVDDILNEIDLEVPVGTNVKAA